MKPFEQIRVVFFGTPDFAVASLDALVTAGVHVVAVVTAPDKPAGRGMQVQSPAVKEYALLHKLPVLQPEKLKDPQFIEELTALQADVQVVVAFRMLPEVVWNMPPFGTINVHASLLPQYRGAAPINWAIVNGETETGVTTFKLQHAIDTGNILLQQKVAIKPTDNASTLHDKLMAAGAALLVKTIRGIADGVIKEQPQNESDTEIKHAPKIFKDDLLINWNQSVEAIDNFVRGMAPYPGAHTMLGDKSIKIFSTDYRVEEQTNEPGTSDTDNETYLRFAAQDGWLYVDELQQEGKKRMDVVSFLRGFRG